MNFRKYFAGVGGVAATYAGANKMYNSDASVNKKWLKTFQY